MIVWDWWVGVCVGRVGGWCGELMRWVGGVVPCPVRYTVGVCVGQ